MPDTYIQPPLDTDPDAILDEIYDYLAEQIPGCERNDGSPEVWLSEAFAQVLAENRDVAADVPYSIFRYFGAKIFGVLPIDATAASVTSTWTANDNLGHTI